MFPVCTFNSERCCLAWLLSKQDDFQLQKSQVKEKITQRGHFCIFLPKFHCELNPIKMVCLYFILLLSGSEILQYWGWCKHRYRDVYKEMFGDAKRVMHKSLDACLVDIIRRFFNWLWRFMEAYQGGSPGRQLNGPCTNRNLTGRLESGPWCQLRKMSIQIDPARGTFNIKT